MKNKAEIDTIIQLIGKELDEEHEHQLASDNDKTYLKELIRAYNYILTKDKDVPDMIRQMLVKEAISKYINDKED